MRLEVTRYGVKVIPENETDEAYIEDTLGLRAAGDSAPLVRENCIGLSSVAYLIARKQTGRTNAELSREG